MGVIAVLLALAMAWQVSEFGRTTWWSAHPHIAVQPGSDGVASAEGLNAALVEVRPVEQVPTSTDPIRALDGHQLWRVVVTVEAAQSTVDTCQILLADDDGRRYEGGDNVGWGAEGYESYPMCSVSDDGEMPATQQAFLFLTPDDFEPQAVRIQSLFDLNPRYLELPVP